MNEEEMDELIWLWKGYVKTDERLSKGARELKQRLKKYVENIPVLPEIQQWLYPLGKVKRKQ